MVYPTRLLIKASCAEVGLPISYPTDASLSSSRLPMTAFPNTPHAPVPNEPPSSRRSPARGERIARHTLDYSCRWRYLTGRIRRDPRQLAALPQRTGTYLRRLEVPDTPDTAAEPVVRRGPGMIETGRARSPRRRNLRFAASWTTGSSSTSSTRRKQRRRRRRR